MGGGKMMKFDDLFTRNKLTDIYELVREIPLSYFSHFESKLIHSPFKMTGWQIDSLTGTYHFPPIATFHINVYNFKLLYLQREVRNSEAIF